MPLGFIERDNTEEMKTLTLLIFFSMGRSIIYGQCNEGQGLSWLGLL